MTTGYRAPGEQPNFEEIFNLLRGLTRSQYAKYDTVKQWFAASKIIDERRISSDFFDKCYERVQRGGGGDLSLGGLAQLLALLSRETHQGLIEMCDRFNTVKIAIVTQIQDGLREDGVEYNQPP